MLKNKYAFNTHLLSFSPKALKRNLEQLIQIKFKSYIFKPLLFWGNILFLFSYLVTYITPGGPPKDTKYKISLSRGGLVLPSVETFAHPFFSIVGHFGNYLVISGTKLFQKTLFTFLNDCNFIFKTFFEQLVFEQFYPAKNYV